MPKGSIYGVKKKDRKTYTGPASNTRNMTHSTVISDPDDYKEPRKTKSGYRFDRKSSPQAISVASRRKWDDD